MRDYLGHIFMCLYVSETADHERDDVQDVYKTFQNFIYAPANKMLTDMETVSEADFEKCKIKGNVKFNGEIFTGSRTEYIRRIKRELNSKNLTTYHGGYKSTLENLKKFTIQADEDWDFVVLAAHGKADENGEPLGFVSNI